MDGAQEEEADLVDELGEIVAQLRAYLSWQQAGGASGIPRDPRPASELKQAVTASLQKYRGSLVKSDNSDGDRVTQDAQPLVAPPSSPSVTEQTASDFAPPFDAPPLQASPRHPATPAPTPNKTGLPVLGDTLEELQALVRDCTQCGLHETRKQTVFARGKGTSGLCFVGEGPGADEDEQGYPFVGAAGQLLDKMILAMGFERDDVYVCNIVKCRPPNNRKPNDEEMTKCSPFLKRQLELIRPEVIVALGGTATQGLLGDTRGITKIRGKFRLYEGRIAVMPTFHPAYLLRNPSAKKEVWTDLKQVLKHIGRTLPQK